MTALAPPWSRSSPATSSPSAAPARTPSRPTATRSGSCSRGSASSPAPARPTSTSPTSSRDGQRLPLHARGQAAQHEPDPQPAARRHPLPLPSRGPRAPRARRPHRPGPGHPAAQAVPLDGRLADRRRSRRPPGRPRHRHLDRPPGPRPDAPHAHQRSPGSEITRLTWADVTLAKPGARVLWHGKGRKERLSPLQPPAVTGLPQRHRETRRPGSFVFTARAPPGR